MDITPEMEQLRSELNEYADGREARFKRYPLDPEATPAWKYGWTDVDDGLNRSLSGSIFRTV